jgi:hypothetical protein
MDKIIILYILICMFLDSRWEDKKLIYIIYWKYNVFNIIVGQQGVTVLLSYSHSLGVGPELLMEKQTNKQPERYRLDCLQNMSIKIVNL